MPALDSKTNREKRAAEKAQNRPEDQPLDLPFPHAKVPFDPFHFGLEQEPKKPRPSPFPEPL